MQHHSKIGAGLLESGPPGGVGNVIRIEMAAFSSTPSVKRQESSSRSASTTIRQASWSQSADPIEGPCNRPLPEVVHLITLSTVQIRGPVAVDGPVGAQIFQVHEVTHS